MARIEWIISVVDHREKRWPSPESLATVGARAETILRYKRVRREMSPAGLRRKLRALEN